MRKIDLIVIHCADTPATMDIGAAEIRKWHVDGNGWADIGYHYVIRRSGDCEKGREDAVPGAHVSGHNNHSIGICLVGGKPNCNFTAQQWSTLNSLLVRLRGEYPNADLKGHNELDSLKSCPQFDVKAYQAAPAWRAAL